MSDDIDQEIGEQFDMVCADLDLINIELRECKKQFERTERIVKAARQFCDAHIEDYDECLNSDSLDIDAEFMLLCHAIYGQPILKDGKWQRPGKETS